MSQSAVLAQVETKCAGITGLKKVVRGVPNPKKLPATLSSYPFMVIEALPAAVRRGTFSTTGTTFTNYDVILTLYLGPKETNGDDAQRNLLPYSDRLRAAFAPEHTLGGTCLNCDLVGPAENFATYGDEGKNPKAQWALRVTEQVVTNAAAA